MKNKHGKCLSMRFTSPQPQTVEGTFKTPKPQSYGNIPKERMKEIEKMMKEVRKEWEDYDKTSSS